MARQIHSNRTPQNVKSDPDHLEPEPVDVEALLLQIQEKEAEIELLSMRIDSINSHKKTAKTTIHSALKTVLPELPHKEAAEKLNDLYWRNEFCGTGLVKLSQELKIPFKPKLVQEEKCDNSSCENLIVMEYSSWTDYKTTCSRRRDKKHGVRELCRDCAAQENKAREEQAAEWHVEREKRRREEEEAIRWLKSMPYDEYLQTDYWKWFRQKALRRAWYKCELCFSPKQLNTHHKTYERRGEEWLSDVIVLCRTCHEKFHDILPEEKFYEEEGL